MRARSGWRLELPEFIVLAAVAAMLAWQLFVPPIVGLADNGDYDRVIQPLGLRPVAETWADRYFLHVNEDYAAMPRQPILLLSTEILLGEMALWVNAAWSRDGLFHLRSMCIVHVVLYLVGLYLVLLATQTLRGPPRFVAGLIVLLATADVAWIATFNSFFTESAALVFLVLVLGIGLNAALRDPPPVFTAIAFVATAALFVGARHQNYPLALPLAVFPIALLARPSWRGHAVPVIALSIVLAVLPLDLFQRVPHAYRSPVLWDTVFYSILGQSPDPESDLREFGLDPALAVYAGVPAWAGDTPTPHFEVTKQLDFGAVARFYLRNPGRTLAIASACAERAFEWTDPLMGNYTRAAGRPPRALAPSLAGWSELERRVFPRSLVFILGLLGAVVLVGVWELRRHGPGSHAGALAMLCVLLAVMTALEFAATAAASGRKDIVKHLFVFQVLFDVCLTVALAWTAGRVLGGPARRRDVTA